LTLWVPLNVCLSSVFASPELPLLDPQAAVATLASTTMAKALNAVIR
jgi:hypothetical protein